MAKSPGGTPKQIDGSVLKEITEVVRALNPTILSIQRGISRVIAPFFLLTIVYFLTIFETNLPPFAQLDDVVIYGGYLDAAGERVGGVQFYNIRSVSLFLISTLIFYMFVRFGFLYFQGNKLMSNLQGFLSTRLGSDDEVADLLRHVCKENYLIQAMIVMRQDADITGLLGGPVYRVVAKSLSSLMIVLFVAFMGFAQYLTTFYLGNTFLVLAIAVAFLYSAYYLMFVLGIVLKGAIDLTNVRNISLTGNGNYGWIFTICFTLMCLFNILMIWSGLISGWELGAMDAASNKIPVHEIIFPYGPMFSTLYP